MPSKSVRRDNGSGSLYKRSSDGRWIAAISLPPGPDGKPRRKVVTAKDRGVAQKKLRDLRRDLDRAGDLPTASPTVATWLDHWLKNVSAKRVGPDTQKNRANDVRLHIVPAIGKIRLDKLTPADVTRMHNAITGKGNSSTSALRCHRVLSVALRDAVRAGKATRNVARAEYVDAPRAAKPNTSVLTVEQTIKLLETASKDETYGARWATTILTGARRGEVLGLEWDRVTLAGDDPHLVVDWQLKRLIYSHGCQPSAGGAPTCGFKKAGRCPNRYFLVPDDYEMRTVKGGLHLVRPKTTSSMRVIPLVDPLHSYLRAHRKRARSDGLAFTTSSRAPIDPRDDGYAWKALLKSADVPYVRQHDARHGAATLLLSLGVDTKVVSAILGHSSVVMTRAYQHTDTTMTRDALTRLGAALTPISAD